MFNRMKDYLFVIIFIAFNNESVSCWQEDIMTKLNKVTSFGKKDFNARSQNTGEVPCNPMNRDESNFEDRIIFPDQDTYLHNRPTVSTTTHSPDVIQTCVKTCGKNQTYDPVCGTDNITYINQDNLICRRMCGVDVTIQQLSACPETLEVSTKSSPIAQSEILKSCLLLCPSTQEYNPVCGTNNVTYLNYGKMVCAQMCGVDVRVERNAACPKENQITTTKPTETSKSLHLYELSEEFLMCLEMCPTTSEYSPVCGTNDKTYYNIAKLVCARSCGIDVNVLKMSPCSILNVNIKNHENKDLVTPMTHTSTTTATEDFSISQDLLDSIFNTHEDNE